jgi:hypothetical protein
MKLNELTGKVRIVSVVVALLAISVLMSGCTMIGSVLDMLPQSPPPPEYETYKSADESDMAPPRFSGGDGSKSNPYQIASAEDLRALSMCLRPVRWTESYANAYYVQTGDIDLAGEYWIPIGSDTEDGESIDIRGYPFSGKYDGGGYKVSNMKILISWNAVYDLNHFSEQGLFGLVAYNDNPEVGICNLTLANADVQIFDDYTNAAKCGGLIGIIRTADVQIENCTVAGIKIEACSGDVGMIAGMSSGKIINCAAEGKINYLISEYSNAIGGFVGYNDGQIVNGVSNCILTFRYEDDPNYDEAYAGGFVGTNALWYRGPVRAMISNSYARGEMILKMKDPGIIYRGTFTGENVSGTQIENCDSDVHCIESTSFIGKYSAVPDYLKGI